MVVLSTNTLVDLATGGRAEGSGPEASAVDFTDPSTRNLHLRFQDNTSLNFAFATGFATEAYFSRWKHGNERVLRYWPRIHYEPVF